MSDEKIFLPMQHAKVDEFAELMKAKLTANRRKGHWGNETIEYLLRRLNEEMAELFDAIATNRPYSEIGEEAIDVANFAMMIADRYGFKNIEVTDDEK